MANRPLVPNTDTQSLGEPSGHEDVLSQGTGTTAHWALRPDDMRVSREEGVARGTHRGMVPHGEAGSTSKCNTQ